MRYVRRPHAGGWIEDETYPADAPLIADIRVSEHEATDTGLIWSDGSPIYRIPNPMGFGKDEEW